MTSSLGRRVCAGEGCACAVRRGTRSRTRHPSRAVEAVCNIICAGCTDPCSRIMPLAQRDSTPGRSGHAPPALGARWHSALHPLRPHRPAAAQGHRHAAELHRHGALLPPPHRLLAAQRRGHRQRIPAARAARAGRVRHHAAGRRRARCAARERLRGRRGRGGRAAGGRGAAGRCQAARVPAERSAWGLERRAQGQASKL